MIHDLNLLSGVWFDWMFSMFWQVSLLIIIITGIDYLIRNWAYPQVRYALWVLVLLKLLLPPAWTFSGSIIPNIRNEIESESAPVIETNDTVKENPQTSDQTFPPILNPTEKIQNEETFQPQANEAITAATDKLNWKFYLMGVWVLGIIVFSFILGKRISKIKKWHREQEKRKDIPEWFHEVLVRVGDKLSVNRLPAIVFSNEAFTPAVYGIFRPVLLLPDKYIDELTQEEAEHVLLHELAHVKRGDLIVHGFCLLLQIFYWFNPFLIWARKQMKHVREICCDITIANILREKTQKYKDTLVNTARKLLTESIEPGMGLLGLFEEPYQLIARLKWLNKETWKNRTLANFAAIFVALLFMATVMPMGPLSFNYSIDEKLFEEINFDNDNYREIISSLNKDLNEAFIKWDIETILAFHTEDIIIEPTGESPIEGIDNLKEYLRSMKSSGFKYNSLQTFITELWKDGENIYSIESYLGDIFLGEPDIDLSVTGRSLTIWETQDDKSLKIKYLIINLENAVQK